MPCPVFCLAFTNLSSAVSFVIICGIIIKVFDDVVF